MRIGRFEFEGPYANTASLSDAAGVYVIINSRPDGNYVMDVGESSSVKTRIENHDRAAQWSQHAVGGTLRACVLYTPGWQQSQRTQIEQELRGQFNPPCGDR